MRTLLHTILFAVILSLSSALQAQPGSIPMMDALSYYPGDFDALYRIISERMVYPKAEKKKGIEGDVFVKFSIDSAGHTSNHTIFQSVNPAFDEEALRVVRTIDGFVPARAGGQPVASEFVLQVQFKLPKDASASDKKKKSK